MAHDARTALQSSSHDPRHDPVTSMSVPKHRNSIMHHSLSHIEYRIQQLGTNFDVSTQIKFISNGAGSQMGAVLTKKIPQSIMQYFIEIMWK